MKARLLVSAVGVPFLLVVLIVLPPWGTMGLCALLSAVAAHELLHAVGTAEKKRMLWGGVLFAAAVPVLLYACGASTVLRAVLGGMVFLAFLDLLFTRGTEKASSFADVCALLFSSALLPLAFSCLLRLRMDETGGRLLVLSPLFAAFLSDTGAFFAGRFFGRHKLAPLISPNKTVEGAVGGLVGGVIGMLIFGALVRLFLKLTPSWTAMAAWGVIGSIFGQIGDLSFSAIKREYDIKDFGKLLPGHGGVLDRFDSVLFVTPVFLLLTEVFPL
ncbi:MAG: phosphatidate cytidylyltransferase [Oscillospiraceae bacterium]|nr:phosphatidate cytidylyltransferase [Oscillospiraceae bacterium]